MLDIVDIRAVCDMAHKAGAKVVLDNAFATPMLQRPLEWGADIVVHSATKYIDGQGRTLGGAILGSKEFILEKLQPIIRNTGPSLSPFNAWVLVKGMETLGLRIDRHCANAARVADALAAHPAIARVLYPGRSDHPQHKLAMKQMSGAGGVVTFDLKAGKWAAFETLNRLKLIDISNNLGDAKSLVTHPATTTHMRIGAEERAKLGINDGTVRISVGLEDVEDIIADLVQALGGLETGGLEEAVDAAMSLAKTLWDANADLAQRILAHRFVRGLGDGSLSIDNFKGYVAQDAYFLEAFARSYAFCLAYSTAREDIQTFADLIGGVREELELHKSYAQRWQVEIGGTPPLAATTAYTAFLLETAERGDLGETIAAMTPCMRLYAFLGRSLAAREVAPLYSEWVKTYADPGFEALAARLETLLDRHATDSAAVRANYRRAMELEYGFFDANV